MNLNTFLLIDGSLMLIGLPLLMILKEKRRLLKSIISLFISYSYNFFRSNAFGHALVGT